MTPHNPRQEKSLLEEEQMVLIYEAINLKRKERSKTGFSGLTLLSRRFTMVTLHNSH